MKKKIILICLSFLPVFGVSRAFALPFNQDMVGTQLGHGAIMRPNPEESIPKGSGARYVGTKEEALALKNPVVSDETSIKTGERLFVTNCSPCHGKYFDDGGKYVAGAVSSQLPGPNLAAAIYKEKPDGHFFQFIYFGGMAIMPAYGWKFSIKEHWDIVNYIRHIQSPIK